MFCHKCGNQLPEDSGFCTKCGTKLIADEAVLQTTATPQHETITPVSTIVEDTQHTQPNNATKENRGLHNLEKIGRVIFGISVLLMFLCSFVSLPINPIIIVVGVATGIILSALGLKRPLRITKIIELAVAGFLLILVIIGAIMTSGGGNDKYIKIVKDGTLDGYPQKTVGKAFDEFLDNPKWESGLTENDERFVNVKGGIVYFDKEAELAVQFFVDEKNEIFLYNACEINGAPQNNLVFWNLLQTIYNDDSALAASASQSNLDTASNDNRIVVDETQYYDNEFGNMEVTLDYVEFIDKIENPLIGGYNYPDEGSVFLRAAFTLKNIGTENGSLITAWSAAVYDGTYEFKNLYTEGTLTDINPLTPPATGALIFSVPNDVAESNKSLVININDGSGEAVISYETRPAANTSGESGTESPYPSISYGYEGISIDYLLESVDNVIFQLGDSQLNDEFKLRYDDLEFYHDNGAITSIVCTDPSLFEADGVPLNKNREGLISIFGQPYEEGNGGGGYFMSYNLPDCSIYFELGEPVSEVWRVSISPSTTTASVSGEMLSNGEPISTRDFVGTYSYDASFEDPTGKWNNFYYLLEIGLDGSALVVTQTWRGNYIFDHAIVSPGDITGNTLVFDASVVGSTEPEIHSLTYLPAKDSPLGKDTIYIDDDETMPYVRE